MIICATGVDYRSAHEWYYDDVTRASASDILVVKINIG
jgi:hypothetical protein